MAMVKFLQGTSAQYKALAEKDPNTLYFLTDTFQIMKGAVAYTEKVIVVSELPATGIQGVLYVLNNVADDSRTLHFWDGSAFQSMSIELVTEINAESDDKTAPTAKAVKTYVDSQLGQSAAVAINKVEYSNDTHALSVTKGADAAVTTYIAGLVTDYSYNNATGEIELTLTDNAGSTAVKKVSIPKEQALTGVVQHTVTEEEAGKGIYASAAAGEIGLLLTVSNLVDASEVQYFVGLSNFIDVYTSGSADSDPVKIVIDQDTNKISATISLNENEFEVVEGKVTVKAIAMSKVTGLQDALDAIIAAGMKKMDAAAADGAIILGTGAADKVKGSAYTIGGAEADGFGGANKVATEAGAKAYADQVAASAESNAKKYADDEVAKKMTKKAGTANTIILGDADGEAVRTTYGIGAAVIDENATANKVATEDAVAAALSWNTIG